MPTFATIHRAPGLSAEEIAGNAPDVAQSVHATFQNLYVNMFTGFIVTIYEAEDQAALEREFERIGFPWEDVNEIQFSMDAQQLQQMVAGAPS